MSNYSIQMYRAAIPVFNLSVLMLALARHDSAITMTWVGLLCGMFIGILDLLAWRLHRVDEMPDRSGRASLLWSRMLALTLAGWLAWLLPGTKELLHGLSWLNAPVLLLVLFAARVYGGLYSIQNPFKAWLCVLPLIFAGIFLSGQAGIDLGVLERFQPAFALTGGIGLASTVVILIREQLVRRLWKRNKISAESLQAKNYQLKGQEHSDLWLITSDKNLAEKYEAAAQAQLFRQWPVALNLARIIEQSAGFSSEREMLRRDTLHLIAQSSERLGDLEAAQKAYEQLRNWFPGSSATHFTIATLAQQRGDHEQAIQELTLGMELAPFDGEFHLQRARSFRAMGNEAAACEDEVVFKKIMSAGQHTR